MHTENTAIHKNFMVVLTLLWLSNSRCHAEVFLMLWHIFYYTTFRYFLPPPLPPFLNPGYAPGNDAWIGYFFPTTMCNSKKKFTRVAVKGLTHDRQTSCITANEQAGLLVSFFCAHVHNSQDCSHSQTAREETQPGIMFAHVIKISVYETCQ